MAKLKELLNQTLPRNDSAHATLLAVIGGYMIYLAYQMVQDTLSGVSEMSMTTTAILAGVMALCGLGVLAYGIRTWRKTKNAAREAEEKHTEDEQ